MYDLSCDRSGDGLSELRRRRVDHFWDRIILGHHHHPRSPGTHTIPHIPKLGPTSRLHPIIRNGWLRHDLLPCTSTVDTIYAQAISKKAGKKATPAAKKTGGGNNKVAKVCSERPSGSFVAQESGT